VKIIFPYIGDTVGGSHISSALLIEELRHRGHDVLIILHQRGVFASELKRRKLPYLVWDLSLYYGRRPKKLTDLALGLMQLISIVFRLIRDKPDLVHSNDLRCHVTWVLLSRVTGIPLVWHQRTLLPNSRLVKYSARFAKGIISISRFVAESLPTSNNSLSIMLPNPVAHLDVKMSTRAHSKSIIERATGIDQNYSLIGTFGNLREVKDPLLFINAMIELDKITSQQLIVAVFGDDREEYRPRMRALIENSQFKGRVLFAKFRRPIEPWISVCDVVVATSSGDGFGRSLVEAMSLGVPVVATAIGGHLEIIEDSTNGLLSRPGDSSHLAKQVKSILGPSPLRDYLINRGKLDAQRKYSVIHHTNQVMTFYRQLKKTFQK